MTYRDFNLYLVITRLIHKLKKTGCRQGHLNLSSLWDWFIENQEFLVKSKLSPHSGSVWPWGSCIPSKKKDHKVLHIRFFQIVVRGWGNSPPPQLGGNLKFYCGGIFLTKWRKPEEEWFWQFEPFSKLKNSFLWIMKFN